MKAFLAGEADVLRLTLLVKDLKKVPGPFRGMSMGGGTLPFAAIEETPEPGRGRILFVESREEAEIMAGALNLVEIVKGNYSMVETPASASDRPQTRVSTGPENGLPGSC